MQRRLRTTFIALTAAALWGLALDPQGGLTMALHAQAQLAPVSLDVAAATVARISGGRVVAAETAEENGKPMHRIKVLFPDGRVRVYLVDPDTGQMQDD